MTNTNEVKFGVHSEVGKLRKVMVCAPGLAHTRLTPSNCDELLFDDVLWVDNAKRDHFDFINKMRDRGVDVVEMHNLLAETVAVPKQDAGVKHAYHDDRDDPGKPDSGDSDRQALQQRDQPPP